MYVSGESLTVMEFPKWNGGGSEPVVKTARGAYAIGAETGGAGEDVAVNIVGDTYGP
jgi:hypothetical protein